MSGTVAVLKGERVVIMRGPLKIGTFVTFPAPVQKQSYDHQGDRVQPLSVILQTDWGNLCSCLYFKD